MSADEVYLQYASNLNKYDTDKWLLYINQSKNATDGLDDGVYTYQAFAADSADNWNQTEERTVTIDTTYPLIEFVNPTPDNDATTANTSIGINVTIEESNLDEVIYNWNGTNYTIYNDSLVLMMNFDNVSALGENELFVVDASNYGNDGTFHSLDITEGESTTNWATANGNLAIDTDRKQGDYSLKLTATANDGYTTYDPSGTWNFTNDDYITFWAKSGTGSAISDGEIFIFNDTDWDDAYVWNFTYPAEWGIIKLNITDPNSTSGSLDLSTVDRFRFDVNTNGNSGLIDMVTLTKSGQITTGKYGYGFDFDGDNDYVDISDSSSLNISDVITIEAWVYPRITCDNSGVVSKYYNSSEQGYILFCYQGNSSLIIPNDASGSSRVHLIGNTLPLNIWTHLVGIYNGTIVKLYENGVEVKSDSYNLGIYDSGEEIVIGDIHGGDGGQAGHFNGSIDEVRIWNRSLSADEVYQQYASNLNKYDTDKWLLYINQSKNATDGLDDGIYTYQAFAADTVDNWNQTEERTVTIDTTLPTIYLTSPVDDSSTEDQTPDFTFNVSSWTSDTFNCTLYVDNGTEYYVGMNDTTENATATTITSTMTLLDDDYDWWVNCTDQASNENQSAVWTLTIALTQLNITKIIDPLPILAGSNETLSVNTSVQVNQTSNGGEMFNITDDVPWDFTAPTAGQVTVFFVDYSAGTQTEITTNTSVYISVSDQAGSLPTLVRVNISNISLTDAGDYLEVNDSILITYSMTTSQMAANGYRLIYTNATVTDNASQAKTDYLLTNITASQVLLRGYKEIWFPDLGNPQNLSVRIMFSALGGPSSGIYIADYLPQGATVADLNVSYYNSTVGGWFQLTNSSDFYVALGDPYQTVLPDNTYVDVHNYNFSYAFTNWDGNLYDNDTIRIEYNITLLGGGEWILPTIIAGFDPEYQKHIKTEMYASANVPSFDVMLEMLTDSVKPGGVVKALLRILNVGGPRAKVDVFVTYSAKTLQGEILAERSETLAVVEQKEKSLELGVPDDLPPGTYAFESYVTYTGREALSTGTFVVEGEASAGMIEEYGLYLFLVAVILVLALMYFRATRRKGFAKPSLGLLALCLLVLGLLTPLCAANPITGSLEVLKAQLEPGDEAKALFKLRNSNFTGYRTDVHISYSLSDPTGNMIKSESGTFPVTDSRDMVFKLSLPKEAPPGVYSFDTSISHPSGESTYRDSFQVIGPESPLMLYILTLPVMGLVLGVVITSRRSRRKGG